MLLTRVDAASQDAPVTWKLAPEFRGSHRNPVAAAPAARPRPPFSQWRCPGLSVAADFATRRAFRVLLTGIVASLALVPAGGGRADDIDLRAAVGAKPLFTLTDLSGTLVRLTDLRGHPVLVHFFATWCEPCRDELPALRRLAERSPQTRILALSVGEPDDRVRRFREAVPVDFPLLLDRDGGTAKAWDVSILPTTYVLDADLAVRLVAEHDVAWDRPEIGQVLDGVSTPEHQPETDQRSRIPQGG